MCASVRPSDATVPRFNWRGGTGPDSRIPRTGFRKRVLGFEKRDLENGKRDSEKRAARQGRGQGRGQGRVRLSVCLAGQGGRAGQGAGQGPNKEIRKNKTYKTSHWSKVTGTHGGLHSGLRPRAPTSIGECNSYTLNCDYSLDQQNK